MSKGTYPLKLPASIKAAAARLAKEDDLTRLCDRDDRWLGPVARIREHEHLIHHRHRPCEIGMRYGPTPPNVGLADVMAALRDPGGDAFDGVLDRGDANEDEAHRIPEPLGAPDQAKVRLVGEDCLRDQRLASREEPSEFQGDRPQPTEVGGAPGL